MRRSDTDSSEEVEEEALIEQESEGETCAEEEIADPKVDYDEDNKLANAPAWFLFPTSILNTLFIIHFQGEIYA